MPPATERQPITVQIELALLSAGALVMRQAGAEGTTETGENFEISTNMSNCGLIFQCRGRFLSLTPEAFANAAFAALDQAGITGPSAPDAPAATDATGDDVRGGDRR